MNNTTNASQEMPELQVFLDENLNEFQPFAIYDKHMDCIRVQIRDCNFYEERVNKYVTELYPLVADVGTGIIGFNIKGVRYMIAEHFSDVTYTEMTIPVVKLVDLMVKQFPENTMKKFAEAFETINSSLENLSVELPMAA